MIAAGERFERLAEARDELRSILEGRAAGRRAPQAAGEGRAFLSEHTPWEAIFDDGVAGQRAFLRSTAPIRVIVAGRQAGKTHQAAEECIRIILARPGTESCLLMPNYKSTKGALRHLRRALAPIRHLVVWKEVDKCFVFANGAKLYLRTADDKSGVPTRGLTLDGVLWVDEASFVPRSAWNAAQATQVAVADPKVVVTTTPRGRKSWVFDLCVEAEEGGGSVEWFRFRSTDSPHVSESFVKDLRRRLGRQVADEELNAVFLGETDVPFHPDDIERAFGGEGGARKLPVRGERLTIGLDLAKKKDYTVATLMNEFGEVWVLKRFRADTFGADRFWPRAKRTIVELAEKHSAVVVVDVGYGGGFGESMKDYLVEALGEEKVFGVKTGNVKVKAKLIEDLIGDLEAGRLLVSEGQHSDDLRAELTYFPRPERRNEGGVEMLVYKGPSDEGEEHDDTVISLALARWGRDNAWGEEKADPLGGDFSGFGGAGKARAAGGSSPGATKPRGRFGGFGGVGARRNNGRSL